MDSVKLAEVRNYLRSSADLVEHCLADLQFSQRIVAISGQITQCFRLGNKLMLAGNGGSAGDAQHIAGEFLSRLNFDRAPLPAIALTVDTSVLTAIGNDYGFHKVFARQVIGLGKPGDLLIAITTSGRSPNIVAAIAAARQIGAGVIGLTGNADSGFAELCDLCLSVPSSSTPLIQQLHITAAHIICGQVEATLFPRAS